MKLRQARLLAFGSALAAVPIHAARAGLVEHDAWVRVEAGAGYEAAVSKQDPSVYPTRSGPALMVRVALDKRFQSLPGQFGLGLGVLYQSLDGANAIQDLGFTATTTSLDFGWKYGFLEDQLSLGARVMGQYGTGADLDQDNLSRSISFAAGPQVSVQWEALKAYDLHLNAAALRTLSTPKDTGSLLLFSVSWSLPVGEGRPVAMNHAEAKAAAAAEEKKGPLRFLSFSATGGATAQTGRKLSDILLDNLKTFRRFCVLVRLPAGTDPDADKATSLEQAERLRGLFVASGIPMEQTCAIGLGGPKEGVASGITFWVDSTDDLTVIKNALTGMKELVFDEE